MICPTCQLQNPDNARFCARCGATLAATRCSNCQAELVSGASFCSSCGRPVNTATAATDQDRLARLAASIPEPLGEKVRSAARLVEERRIVTILVAEILTTSPSEEDDLEDAAETISTGFDRLAPDIYRYEGTIARLVGNTLLAFFGAPVTHEDDPLRGVRAALDLLITAREFSAEVKQQHGLDLSVRIGLSTGSVIIGQLGTNLTYEYTALGGAVNLGESVMNKTQPNTVAVTANIYRFIAPYYDCTEIDTLKYEKRGDILRIYQVNGPKLQPLPGRGLPGLTSPMVGRKEELDSLLMFTSIVQAGVGRGVLIIGEPGLGKSRLIAEWRAAVEKICSLKSEEGCPIWVEGHSVSYGHGLPFHLLANMLRSLIGVSPTALEPEIRAALQNLTLQLLGDQNAEAYLYLAHLLSLQLTYEDREKLSLLDPQALQAQYLTAIRRLMVAFAAKHPLIIILEDLHWADPSSTDLLIRMLPLVSQAQILFCVVCRPDQDSPGWKLVLAMRESLAGTLKEIPLNALNEDDSQLLVSNLLEVAALPLSIRALILRKSEGNPFFVEEVIRMLIDRGIIVQQNEKWVAAEEIYTIRIPDNLQGLLLARIDRLPNDVKRTLRLASVIGRLFSVRLLSEVVKSEELEWVSGHLVTLEAHGLIRLSQVGPEMEYLFRHNLTREAAYTSLLKNDRKRLHKVVGETLEKIYPDKLNENASLLANHFLEAGEDRRAFRYFTIAADKALNRYASKEAEKLYYSALKLTDVPEERAHILTGLGRALELQSRFEESIQSWLLAIELYRQLDNLEYVAVLYANISRTAWHAGDTPGGLKYSLEGLSIVGEDQETAGTAALLHEAGRAYHFNGKPDEALDYCKRALKMAKKLDVIDVQAEALTTIGILSSQNTDEKLEALFQAVKLAEQAGLLRTAARAHHNIGSISPDNTEAITHFRRSAEINRMIGSVVEEFNELASLTGMLLGEGNLNEVAANLEEMRKLLKEIADPAPAKIYLDLLEANLLLFQGHWGEALKIMRPCLEDTRQRGDLQTTSNMDLTFAQILIEIAHWEGISDWEEAETALQEAIDIAGRGVAVQTSPLSLLAGIRILQGRVDSAKQMLTEAEAMVGANTYPVEETLLIWMKGHLAIAQDQWDEALDFFKTATKRMKDMGLRWNWARITRDWAEALITRRQPSDLEQARVLLTQCLEIFRQIGATHYAELVDERLSTLNSAIRAEMIDKEKVSADLAMAGRIQGSLMPEKMPIITGWELAAFLEPAQETSGDFYDFITLPDGKIGLLIADVTDKGPGAALFMALSRTLIRTFAALHTADPENAIIAANQRMHEDTRGGLFVSLFYAVLDPNTSTLSYVNAGHNPPYLFRPGDAAHPVSLEKTGTQLGLFDDAIWTHATVKLETGDVLLLYTDGVLDAQNPEEEVFGSERLIAEAKTMLDCPAQELMENLYHVIQKFMGKAPMADDITLMILKRE